MPEEAAAGCLVGILRLFAFLAELTLEWCGEWFLGYIGKWTLYTLSLGHCDRDHEDGVCILTGLLVCMSLFVLGVWLL